MSREDESTEIPYWNQVYVGENSISRTTDQFISESSSINDIDDSVGNVQDHTYVSRHAKLCYTILNYGIVYIVVVMQLSISSIECQLHVRIPPDKCLL